MAKKIPLLLTTEAVAKRLGISRATLQKQFPHLPHVVVQVQPKRVSRFFPTAFIETYEAYLQVTNRKAIAGTALAFSHSPIAIKLYAQAVEELTGAINAREAHTPKQLGSMLGVDERTIVGWVEKGILRAKRERWQRYKGFQPVTSKSEERYSQIVVSASEVFRVLHWATPE